MKVRAAVTQDSWLQARLALLEKEKALTRLRDEVTRERQALPCTSPSPLHPRKMTARLFSAAMVLV